MKGGLRRHFAVSGEFIYKLKRMETIGFVMRVADLIVVSVKDLNRPQSQRIVVPISDFVTPIICWTNTNFHLCCSYLWAVVSINEGKFSTLYGKGVNTVDEKSLGRYSSSMDIQRLIKRYGSQQAVAQAFGVTKGAVSQWVKAGAMPKSRAWQAKAGLVKPPKGR